MLPLIYSSEKGDFSSGITTEVCKENKVLIWVLFVISKLFRSWFCLSMNTAYYSKCLWHNLIGRKCHKLDYDIHNAVNSGDNEHHGILKLCSLQAGFVEFVESTREEKIGTWKMFAITENMLLPNSL